MENLIGKDNFQKLLILYINKFTFKSVSWIDFKLTFNDFVEETLGAEQGGQIVKSVDWDGWVKTTGEPLIKLDFCIFIYFNLIDSKWTEIAENFATKFLKNHEISETEVLEFFSWHTNVKLVFISFLAKYPTNITDEVYINLRDKLKLHNGHNAEISYTWYQIALKRKQADVVPFVQQFLLTQGRMKYIKPVYIAYVVFDKHNALDFFDKHK